MNAIDQVRKIEELASVPEKYRANWLPLAKKLAVQVNNEIERLRAFAQLRTGFVADHCHETADYIETELQSAMAALRSAEHIGARQ